jgi:hypothetical protein
MRNVSDRLVENIKTHNFMFINFFSKIRAICAIPRKCIVEPDKPQMTIWCMLIQTHTQNR